MGAGNLTCRRPTAAARQREQRLICRGTGAPTPAHQYAGATSTRRQNDAGAVQRDAPVCENEQAQGGGGHARQLRGRDYGTVMTTTQWGRKETIVRPPRSPIYSYGAAI